MLGFCATRIIKKMKKICSIYHDLNRSAFFSALHSHIPIVNVRQPDFALKLFFVMSRGAMGNYVTRFTIVICNDPFSAVCLPFGCLSTLRQITLIQMVQSEVQSIHHFRTPLSLSPPPPSTCDISRDIIPQSTHLLLNGTYYRN